MTKKSESRGTKWSIAAAVALAAAVSGCDTGPKPGSARSSGSVAISQDDALVYAADSDNGVLAVVDAKTSTLVTTVSVGARPFRVVVGKDDSIYVANRDSRSVSVIRRGDWRVGAVLDTDVDPVGMAISEDGKTVYVVCETGSDSSDFGTLAAYDVATTARSWTMKLPDEPRGIALLGSNKAAVGLYKAGDVVMVDLDHQVITQGGTDLYRNANSGALSLGGPTVDAPTFHPRAMSDLAATPDGSRVFATALLSREAPLVAPENNPPPDAYAYGSKGPNLSGSVATPAIATFDVNGSTLTPQIDDLSTTTFPSTNSAGPSHPQFSFATSGATQEPLIHGSTAAVVDGSGNWLYVVNRDSKNVMIVPTATYNAHVTTDGSGGDFFQQNELPSLFTSADIGDGADGIAVTGDNKAFYVYSQFDHRLQRFTMSGQQLTEQTSVTVASETLAPALAQGRRQFYDATDRRVSSRQAAISCGSCHLEGREDGHVWFAPDGPRQTPSLAGRGMLDTPPYYWSGEFATLTDFLNRTIAERMGGTGIDQAAADSINQYVGSLAMPENPNVKPALTDAQQRGATVFAAAGCGACHTGQWLTNDALVDVGTVSPADNGNVVSQGINVPSLKGLARTAPYLHDGSIATLEERIRKNPGDKHGVTSNLNDAQVGDLVAYLKSL